MGLEEYNNNNNMNDEIELEIEDKYLSEAQQKEVLKTAGDDIKSEGPSMYEKPNDYLSDAQRDELRNNNMTAGNNGTNGLNAINTSNDEFEVRGSDSDHTSD